VRTLVHAVEDGVFDQVTEDGILPSNAPQELSQLGITEVMGSQQVLTGPGHHYFTPDQDRYLGFYLSRTWELRTHVIIPRLAETIKIGRSAMQNKSNSTHFSSTAKMFFSLNNDPAQQLANHLVSLEGVNTALDLGAGSAVWSIPLAQRKHNLHVDALDLLPVLDATRAFTERYGVQKQYSFLPGDFLTLDRWGQGSYDLIYMGYVCCMSSRAENQSLLTRCVRNLRPGGYLALADFFPKPDRTGPFRDVLFSVQMLISIDGGDTYDPETYEGWCRDAGLSELAWIPVPALDVPLLIARKATI
jgi:ubiquinone/menaquinone biosynthesis C-methylase UbiE